MAEGEEEFELKDNKYTFLIPYAEGRLDGDQWVGKRPHQNSGYIKCFVASAERMGKKPSDFIGNLVTLEKVPTVLFQHPKIDPTTKKPITGEDGKKIMEDVIIESVFSFVADESVTDITAHICDLVVGLNQQAALRKLLTDTRAKAAPKFKDALKAGVLAEMLGLVVVEGLFQKPAGEASGSSNS